MKVSYTNMKLKVNTQVNTFDFAGQKIEVLKYLPVKDKYDLLTITLQKGTNLQDGTYNDFLITVFFELNLVYMYTNISFTEKQREDEEKLYDTLKSNGFFEEFFKTLNEDEYNELYMSLNTLKKDYMAYKMSVSSILKDLVDNLPKNAEAAAKIVEEFDSNKYKAVVDFARAANGGRDIVTNQPIESENK